MIRQVAINPRVETKEGSAGGSAFGKIAPIAGALGAAALIAGTGGAAAPVAGASAGAAGGASAASILGGAGSGAALGGLLGNAVDRANPGTDPIQRRIDATQPQIVHSENSQKLRESIMALHQAPPEVQNQYAPTLLNAYLTSLHQDKVGGMA